MDREERRARGSEPGSAVGLSAPRVRRVAALYDVHGNLPALESVLGEVAEAHVDRVVVGGDLVPGPMPRECLHALRALDVPVDFLRGNGDVDVVATAAARPPARVPERFHPLMRWVADALDEADIAFLAEWPATVRLDVGGVAVLFCHATPRDENEIFTRITPDSRVEPAFASVSADVVVCGHTHMPFERTVGGVRVINAGSVGMPFGGSEACWLLLDGAVTFRSTAYDLDAAASRLGATGYPGTADFDVRRPPSAEAMLAAFEAASVGSGT